MYSNGKIKWVGNKKKENELRMKGMQCIDTAFVYLKWVSAMWCIGIILFLIDTWYWRYLKQKSNL